MKIPWRVAHWIGRMNRQGQDLVEYALMAGFVALATVATIPGAAEHFRHILFQAGSILKRASGQSFD